MWQLPRDEQPSFDETSQEQVFFLYCLTRGLLWAALNLYRNAKAVQQLKRAKKPVGPPAIIAAKWSFSAIVIVASGIFSYALCWLVLHPATGSIRGLSDLDAASPLGLCLAAWIPDSNCAASAVMFLSTRTG